MDGNRKPDLIFEDIKKAISNTLQKEETLNDNFNDVLIFALFGMVFLIFTDYIYKLGKKSY